MLAMRLGGVRGFDPFPGTVPPLCWPTLSRGLFRAPERYIARTRVNQDYGRPGWTRECGRRFHRGVDIAPVRMRPAGREVCVLFTDCATGREYDSSEPAWIPEDDVFSVRAGELVECNGDPDASDLGCYVVVRHPGEFFTLYAHLADLAADPGRPIAAGDRLGSMGQTSRSADARNWMAIAPHLHFEVIAADGGAHDPLEFLVKGLASGPQSAAADNG